MKKGKKLYEGKAKIIYTTNDKDLVIQYFIIGIRYIIHGMIV